MYICIYVYICIYICVYIYVYMYLCIYVYMYMCIYVYMYIYKYTYLYIYRYMYDIISAHLFIYLFIYVHMRKQNMEEWREHSFPSSQCRPIFDKLYFLPSQQFATCGNDIPFVVGKCWLGASICGCIRLSPIKNLWDIHSWISHTSQYLHFIVAPVGHLLQFIHPAK